jgi:hypothetical protein
MSRQIAEGLRTGEAEGSTGPRPATCHTMAVQLHALLYPDVDEQPPSTDARSTWHLRENVSNCSKS